MSIVGWIVLGLMAGFTGGRIAHLSDHRLIMETACAVMGSLAGGWLCKLLGHADIAGFNLYSMFVAFMGSLAALFAWHEIRRV